MQPLLYDMKSNLFNKIIQIAGSSSKDTEMQIIHFSHNLIKLITKKLLERGAKIVSTVGKEDRLNPNDDTSPSLVYYWDVLEALYEYAKTRSFSEKIKNSVKIISSEKTETQIPEDRKQIWYELTSRSIISLKYINPGWNAGAYKRQEQEKLTDALILLGGGEGVEHLASLYIAHGKEVLPLDIPLGSRYGNGIGGSFHLSRKAIANPKIFIPRINEDTASRLTNLSYERWKNSYEDYANHIVEFLELSVKPQVFYVRLLNKDEKEYRQVEIFFREVVDPIVKQFQYSIKDMGISEVNRAFLNTEIFNELHNSSVVIADISGLRPNCFIELGYAFGLNKKVLPTAIKGTKLPFDQSAIPCHFWDPILSLKERKESFLDFWIKNIDRSPLVSDVYNI